MCAGLAASRCLRPDVKRSANAACAPGSRRERRPSMRRASAQTFEGAQRHRSASHGPPSHEAPTPWRDMRLQRPGVRIEDRCGNPVTFFQLKLLAEAERREVFVTPSGPAVGHPRRPNRTVAGRYPLRNNIVSPVGRRRAVTISVVRPDWHDRHDLIIATIAIRITIRPNKTSWRGRIDLPCCGTVWPPAGLVPFPRMELRLVGLGVCIGAIGSRHAR